MKIKIISDSICDLPKAFVEKHGVRIAPLSIAAGDDMFQDGVTIMQKDIFEFVEGGKGMCKTSAINSAEYTDVYKEELEKCDAIIHFCISSDMSLCYQNARVAAAEFDNIYVIDARNLSSGVGHLVLDAAEMAAKGMTAKEIVAEIQRLIPLVDASFVLNTLKYLHLGGRCTGVQKLASSVLKIKPCISVQDGKMSPTKKYRGKLEAVLKSYVKDKLDDPDKIDTRRIFITHTLDDEHLGLADAVQAQVAELMKFDEVIQSTAGGTISCHCGPNTLGILFYKK